MLRAGLLFVSLVLSACPGKGGAPPRDAVAPEPAAADGVTLRVEAAAPPLPGAAVEVVATLRNPGRAPVLVLSLSVSGPAGEAGGLAVSRRSPASVEADGVRVSGRLFVESIGPQARLPAPPRWEWEGRDEVVLVTVLRPAEELAVRGRVIGAEGALGAVAEIAAVPDRGLYRLAEIASEHIAAADEPMGWNPTLALTARYRAAPDLAPAAARRPEGLAELPLFPDFAVAGGVAGLHAVRASAPFVLAAPALALPNARARAGIADGASAYVADLGGWVLEGPGGSALVTAGAVEPLPGRWVEAAAVAAAEGRVDIGRRSDVEDPDGLVAALLAAGVSAHSSMEKGGGYHIGVRFPPGQLVAVARVLASRGWRLEGGEIVK